MESRLAGKAALQLRRLNGLDLTKIVYPIVILLTGLYIIPSLNQFIMGLGRGPMVAVTYMICAIAFSLVPAGFAYLAFKRVRLKFRWSALSVIGIILIVFFSLAFAEYISQGRPLSEFFLPGWDHFSFPIAFGFFYLCDLRGFPGRFWLLLLPFAVFSGILGNAILIGNSVFNANVFQAIGGPNYPFAFFSGASNWEGVLALPSRQFLNGLVNGFLQEFLTFFTLFPVVIFYHLIRKEKNIPADTPG